MKEKLHSLRLGDHACLIYKNLDDQLAAVIPYLTIGLERNEQCVFLADPLALEHAKERLTKEGVNVDHEISRGALVLMKDREYLQDGVFVPEVMVRFVDNAIKDALKAGFTGLRGTGDMIWEMSTDLDLKKLIRYEIMMDSFLRGKKLLALCQYRSGVIPPSFIRHSMYTHPIVVLENKICRANRFYNPSQRYTDLPADLETEVIASMYEDVLEENA